LCIHELNYDSHGNYVGVAGDGEESINVFEYDYFIIVSAYSAVFAEGQGSILCKLYLNKQDTGVQMYAIVRPNHITEYPWILSLTPNSEFPDGGKPCLDNVNNKSVLLVEDECLITVCGGDSLGSVNANDTSATYKTISGQVFRLRVFQNKTPTTKWTEEQKQEKIFVSYAVGLERYSIDYSPLWGAYHRVYGNMTWKDLIGSNDENEEFSIDYWVQVIRCGASYFLIPFDYKNK